MAGRTPIDRILDDLRDKLREVVGALAPQTDAIPVPVRPDRRPDPRR